MNKICLIYLNNPNKLNSSAHFEKPINIMTILLKMYFYIGNVIFYTKKKYIHLKPKQRNLSNKVSVSNNQSISWTNLPKVQNFSDLLTAVRWQDNIYIGCFMNKSFKSLVTHISYNFACAIFASAKWPLSPRVGCTPLRWKLSNLLVQSGLRF